MHKCACEVSFVLWFIPSSKSGNDLSRINPPNPHAFATLVSSPLSPLGRGPHRTWGVTGRWGRIKVGGRAPGVEPARYAGRGPAPGAHPSPPPQGGTQLQPLLREWVTADSTVLPLARGFEPWAGKTEKNQWITTTGYHLLPFPEKIARVSKPSSPLHLRRGSLYRTGLAPTRCARVRHFGGPGIAN